MKLSELIEQLEDCKAEYGDVEVMVGFEPESIDSILVNGDPENREIYII